ncbi:MAG: Polyribonucleotide nucleotidyltransferase [Candidatus Omnitrophica bacterium]|nr:Polyribonucleotide nucleotidyltransferase [Candidatus Omnitrophota bacterium]
MHRTYEITLGQQRIVIETGRMAKQADGAVTVRVGDTIVLVAVCVGKKPKANADFFPLSCEYQEKSYAGGKIPGSYFRREGKSTEKETLVSRLIDRPIRPLFPEGFYHEVQVIANVLSADKVNNSDIPAMIGASAALMISGAPYLGPMAAARVGLVDGRLILNPTFDETEKGDLDIVVASTEKGIIMIEAGAKFVPETKIIEALEFAREQLKPLLELQRKMQAECGKPTLAHELQTVSDEFLAELTKFCAPELERINNEDREKEKRYAAVDALYAKAKEHYLVEGATVTEGQLAWAFHEVEKDEVRRYILDKQVRPDGRRYDEIRPISIEVGVLPRAHGSALFTRGQTQSLGVATLGTSKDEQMIDSIDSLDGNIYKSFMLHYNFPPFSVGEIKPVRGPGRREVGHGALAERGIKPVLPTKEAFPYTLRIVSEILESNGSSSMASVCSGSLALMDAGVPTSSAVSGIAMGLVTRNGKYAVLTDIAGVEDHLGDMDFKVTGNERGVTAIQLDLKLKESLSVEMLQNALEQARKARLEILQKMNQALSAPRRELSAFAPRITTIKIDPEKIREIIGPGGKMIRKIQQDSGATIEVEDDGTVRIASSDQGCSQKAIDMIRGITEDPEVGRVYDGTVKRIMNFGAFCEILPGKEGLCHISELSDKYVENVDEVVKVGDPIRVKVIEIDTQGRINLSKKQSTMEGPPVVQRRNDRGDRGDRGGRGDRGDRGDRGGRGDRGDRGERPYRGERGEVSQGPDQKKSWN